MRPAPLVVCAVLFAAGLAACGDDAATATPDGPAALDGSAGSSLLAAVTIGGTTPVATIDFGNVASGSTRTADFEILNEGTAISQPIALDTLAAPFSSNAATTCIGRKLAPGERCHVELLYTAADAGTFTGDARFTANTEALDVALTGKTTTAMLAFATTHVTMDLVAAPSGIAHVLVPIENVGDAAAPLASLAITGAGFSMDTSTCGSTLGPGGTCWVHVAYAATTVGTVDGTLSVDDGAGNTIATTITGRGGMQLTFEWTGRGQVVTETPGFTCTGASCTGLFETGATLLAQPMLGAMVGAWSLPSCGTALTCDVPFGDSLTVTTTFVGTPGVTIELFAGVRSDVRVTDAATGALYGICSGANETCVLDIPGGTAVHAEASSTGVYFGLDGACNDGTTGSCDFVVADSGSALILDIGLSGTLQVEDTAIAPVQAAVFDSTGELVVATADAIERLAPDYAAGSTTVDADVPGGAVALAASSGGTVFAASGTALSRIDPATTTVATWTATLPATLAGCDRNGDYRFTHCLAANANGDVAVRGPAGFGVYTSGGDLRWSLAAPSTAQTSIGIDDTSVYVPVLDASGNAIDVAVYAIADGTPLVTEAAVDTGSLGMILPSGGSIIASETGAEAAYLTSVSNGSPQWTQELALPGSNDTAPNGLTASATRLWWFLGGSHQQSTGAYSWSAYRVDPATGAYLQQLARPALVGPGATTGTAPADIALDAAGHIAIVGAYWHVADASGATVAGDIQIYGP